MLLRPFTLAIDGPGASGKSSTARCVAHQLGFIYVDSGAMYRAVALSALRKGLCPERDQSAVTQVAKTMHFKIVPIAAKQDRYSLESIEDQSRDELLAQIQPPRIVLDDVDITDAIREPILTANVVHVAHNLGVREALRVRQRHWAKYGFEENKDQPLGIVMDGRDIGSVVLPDADLKIFLTASFAVRAARRAQELQNAGKRIAEEQVASELEARDKSDSLRLVQVDDAVVVDTSDLNFGSVVKRIVSLAHERMNHNHKI